MGNWIAFWIVPSKGTKDEQSICKCNRIVMFDYGENRMWSTDVNQINDDGGFIFVGWAYKQRIRPTLEEQRFEPQ